MTPIHTPLPPLFTPATLTPLPGCSVVIGNLDGVHRGHAALLARARQQASPVVALSFEPHPRQFFAEQKGQALPGFRLTPLASKVKWLKAAGADQVVLLDFNAALAALSAQEFIDQVLVTGLEAAHIVVGDDFVFGANRIGTVETLRGDGRFGVTALPPVCDAAGQAYSSTRARTALQTGDFTALQHILGRAFTIEGPVVHGDARGRTIGFPTANQKLEGMQLPPFGIYAVRIKLAGEDHWRDGVANLGIRPMFAVAQPLLETYIFDFAADIYGKNMEVLPMAFIRPEGHYDSLEALVAQIKQDCQAARAVLKSRSL